MRVPAHKGDTKEFGELTFSEQAKSITASINNLCNAIEHHVAHSKGPGTTKKKCLRQIHRLLGRLIEQLPVLFIAIILAGCSDSKEPSSSTPPLESSGQITSSADVSESEAKGILETVLESWAFGDTPDEFKQQHPDITVFELEWSYARVSGEKLARYEIRNARKLTSNLAPRAVGAYEFLVGLEFDYRREGKSTSRRYKVQRNDDASWIVLVNE